MNRLRLIAFFESLHFHSNGDMDLAQVANS